MLNTVGIELLFYMVGMDTSPDAKPRGQRGAGPLNRDYRPGLSAGISGAGFQLENSSIASSVSNRLQTEGRLQDRQGLNSR